MSIPPPAYSPRNFAALSYQPSPADRGAFQQFLLERYGYRPPVNAALVGAIVLGIFFLIPAAICGIVMVAFGVGTVAAGQTIVGLILVLVGLCAIALGVGLGWLLIRAAQRSAAGGVLTTIRLFNFARDNGFQFTPHTESPMYPGMIFNQGHSRASSNRVHSLPGQRFFDIGNMTYTVGSGKNQHTATWGYMAFQLERRLPHIVLDALGNNTIMSNLPSSFSRDQRLSLEGDFDRYFSLYCPREYERDALYVLTPDVMALLIDNAAPFDVEMVDDLVFVYSARPIDTDNLNAFVRMWQVLDTVGTKTLRQTRRYADEQVADRSLNLVAPPGQRLKRSYWPALIVAGVVLAVMVLPTLLPLFVGILAALFR